ncbi:hypothetical protein GOQ29_11610 [Clostridium sp. D2Q-14]|uniref:hypothetical protein n=1 Tax=Anaeromonas gelatinilytica TaxID=2683194 RepID=UPI00193BFEBC|nr:hypothetical protein [Anaeromonas gelatinilytica]MBS4536264.1 hypothetical protein [Anaeromonas gelatinilytica]
MEEKTDYKSQLHYILNKKEKDIFRKNIYEFNEIVSIIDYINPIYIEKELYFNTLFKKRDVNKIFSLVCTEYLKNINHNNNKEEINLTINFIKKFYDIFKPIEVNSGYLIIYPKTCMERYISRIMKEKNFNNVYIPEKTLEELISMIIAFSKFELQNINIKDFGYMNFPTLILANIKLYEKGILSIEKNQSGKILFYLKPMNNTNKTIKIINDERLMMNRILNTLNKKINSNYTINDFLQ